MARRPACEACVNPQQPRLDLNGQDETSQRAAVTVAVQNRACLNPRLKGLNWASISSLRRLKQEAKSLPRVASVDIRAGASQCKHSRNRS